MGRTIIQPIGPLYGEAVNGTVFGRPNGSIYVPSDNKISISTTATKIQNITSGGVKYTQTCSAGGIAIAVNMVAVAQDVASYIQLQFAEDSDFNTYDFYNAVAGDFNTSKTTIKQTNLSDIVSGSTYYVRAVLMSSTGVAVATSDVIELEGKA